MKRAALYARVSTERQDLEGYSIPLQQERLVAYCSAMGWDVSEVFVDPGFSGSTLKRPGLSAMVEAVRENRFDVVVVYKLDRLSRSQRDTLYLIEDVFEASGTSFVSVQESFDTSTIYGRAMLGVISVFAQMERETIAERTLMGRTGRAMDGLWHGGGVSPIGYTYRDGRLVVNPEEAEQVRDVYEMYARGLSVSEICREMSGRKTSHGDWSHTSTVGNVLDNPLYAGTVRFAGVSVPGLHDPIVDAFLDRAVKARRGRKDTPTEENRYLLSGMVYCGLCGARYFVKKRPNGRLVYSCHSRAKSNWKMVRDPNCTGPHVPLDMLDDAVEKAARKSAAVSKNRSLFRWWSDADVRGKRHILLGVVDRVLVYPEKIKIIWAK